jgi:hypothetical protein
VVPGNACCRKSIVVVKLSTTGSFAIILSDGEARSGGTVILCGKFLACCIQADQITTG